ncbi:hypothetical protein [Patulibacter sp.]|uniref:hypothetical protein n=1 Tax=Patulibacter sp. TaxID=1912859 RepID=UPI002725D590|nr:hypothetical protein [Patulibacter sp.]MDO9407248.1 hypothetical protein [Patulibacter sp.]
MPSDRPTYAPIPAAGAPAPAGVRASRGARPAGRFVGLALAAAVPLVAVLGAAPAASAATSSAACRTALSSTLATRDPTVLQDRAVAPVTVRRGTATGVRVVVTRGGRTIASGTAARLAKGTTSVALRLRGTPTPGAVRIRVTGTVSGCGARRASVTYRLRSASLPVRAALRGSTEQNGRTVVRVLLRPVGGSTARGVRVQLRNALGAKVAATSIKGRLTSPTEAVLRAPASLPAGRYSVAVTGRSGTQKSTSSATQTIQLSKATEIAPAAATPDPSRQRVQIAWSGASSAGRDVAGFVVPGVGYGELVCSTGTQWIRVFPTDQSRESSMLTWTYRSWDGNSQNAEKALREALHTQFTGRDFNEGFNKFQPAEKQSTGEFTAILSDRGPFNAPFASSLVAPVGVHVTWAWDFRDPNNARCNAQADIVAQTPGSTGVGSAQVLWRGDAAAAGRDQTVADLPGVGRIQLICQATPSGTRSVRVEIPGASTLTTREGSVDTAVPFNGPVVSALPNNGQLQIDTAAGARILISSRWKVNDPDPAQNTCAVAAQSVAS